MIMLSCFPWYARVRMNSNPVRLILLCGTTTILYGAPRALQSASLTLSYQEYTFFFFFLRNQEYTYIHLKQKLMIAAVAVIPIKIYVQLFMEAGF